MSWGLSDESWKNGYDAWKLATRPEYEGPDEDSEDEDWLIFEDAFMTFLEDEVEFQHNMESAL